MHHSTIRTDVRRPHVATWFGVCSYTKLKVLPEYQKHRDDMVCPICQHDLVKLDYHGLVRFVGGFRLEREFYPDLVEDGRVVWSERVQCGSGSYK